jgi:glycosyltransferase involved in cell wall biosynthesis
MLDIPQLPDGFKVLFAGNIGVSQDFETILVAMESIAVAYPKIHWIVVGDGRMFTWLNEQVKMRHLQSTVHLMGRYPLEVMPSFYTVADALLVSLKCDPVFAMTIPGKLQSYFASGKPVLAMLEGEGARIVEESGAGVTCPSGDSDALVRAVVSLYKKTEAERESMGRNGQYYYDKNFNRTMLISRLEGFLQEVQPSGSDNCNAFN